MRCFFIGHHDTGEEVYPQILSAVQDHIARYGVDEFVVGQYGAFDWMAARAVLEAKKKYPGIKLTILLPYYPSERRIYAPEGYDGTLFPPGMETVPKRVAIVRANRYMVEHSEYLIAYVRHPGNARELLKYVSKKNKRPFIYLL